jgi:alpha-glucosidase
MPFNYDGSHLLYRYGSHAVYLEHRHDQASGKSRSHGVFLLKFVLSLSNAETIIHAHAPFSAAGGDALILTPQNANSSLVQYRMIGGVLDFYFFSGPDPKSVIEQYGALIGLPTWQPAWGFGFQLCRCTVSTDLTTNTRG